MYKCTELTFNPTCTAVSACLWDGTCKDNCKETYANREVACNAQTGLCQWDKANDQSGPVCTRLNTLECQSQTQCMTSGPNCTVACPQM